MWCGVRGADAAGRGQLGAGQQWQQKPVKVALPPDEGEIPWPARLTFTPVSRSQRRRMQRKKLARSLRSWEVGPAPEDVAQPAPPVRLAVGREQAMVLRLSL